MSSSSRMKLSQVLFRLGQSLLLCGAVLFIVSMTSKYWVVRPIIDFQREKIDTNKTVVTSNYGLFLACKQSQSKSDNSGDCGSLWDYLEFIDANTVRYVQFVMCLAAVLYGGSFFLEIVQCLPIDRFRNFLAKNRVVEMFAGIASVLVLHGMVIFAGEVKSKANKVSGQDDEQPGWSFVLAIVGLFLCIVGLIMVTMFRGLPLPSLDKVGGSWLRPASNNVPIHSMD